MFLTAPKSSLTAKPTAPLVCRIFATPSWEIGPYLLIINLLRPSTKSFILANLGLVESVVTALRLEDPGLWARPTPQSGACFEVL